MHTARCPFCGHQVRTRNGSPWPRRRHDIYGKAIADQPAPVCLGSRSVFTIELLGLGHALKVT
jgi:hypothetical protein